MERLNVLSFQSILNKTIVDDDDEVVGILKDIYCMEDGANYPRAVGFRVSKNGDIYSYEFKSINFYEDKKGEINIQIKDARVLIMERYSFRIARDVIGKYITDINGEKSVKIFDATLALFDDDLRVIALDKQRRTFSRRNIFTRAFRALGAKQRKVEPSLILWDDVQNLTVKKDGKLKFDKPYRELETLHPADLAEILENVDMKYSAKVFENFDEEYVAETLEEFEEPQVQAEIIANMSQEKAQDVLQLMDNDEIAEILEDIDEDKKEEIMNNLDQEDTDEVTELLSYEDEEIGSLMNKDFLAFPEHLTVGEVMREVRSMEDDFDFDGTFYVFVTDSFGRLEGYIPLGEFMRYQESDVLKDVMDPHIEEVETDEHAETAVDLCIKYDLLQIPVVNEEKEIVGVVDIHDVIDEYLAPLWKKKNRKD